MPKHGFKSRRRSVGRNMAKCRTRLGRFIRRYRLARTLNQTVLGECSGTTQGAITQIETGKRDYLTKGEAKGIAKVLGCAQRELRKWVRVKFVVQPRTPLGKMLYARRKKMGLTPEELVAKIGEHLKRGAQWVRDMELRAKPYIRFCSARRLARVLALEPRVFAGFVAADRCPAKGEFGKLVRARRKLMLMSAVELAAQGIGTRAYVSLVEVGRCVPARKRLPKWAQALQVDVRRLQAVRERTLAARKRKGKQ